MKKIHRKLNYYIKYGHYLAKLIHWKAKHQWKKEQYKKAGIIAGKIALVLAVVLFFNRSDDLRLTRSKDKNFIYQAKSDNLSIFIGNKKSNQPSVKTTTKDGAHSLSFLYQDALAADKKPTKKGNLLTFKDVATGMDITYQTLPNGLKEELILHTPPEDHFFIFTTELEGSTTPQVVTTDTLQPVIYDAADNYLFHFEKPFAYDAAGARTDNAIIQLRPSPTNPNYFKTILAVDRDWLFSPERIYPIYIDPTIVHDTSDEFVTGTLNRAKDTGSSSAPTMETWYQELPTDQYTSLLWHFNEGTGSPADSSGNGLTGTMTNATWTTTAQLMGNAAVSFDGAGDLVSRADNDLLDFVAADNFTVEAWVKHNGAIATNPDFIIVKAGSGGPAYKIYMDASGDLCFGVDDDTTWNPDDSACTSAVDYDDSLWHHVAGVKTGTSHIKLYVDGLEVATDNAIASTGTLANTGIFYVGIDRDGASNAWDGQIDEVRVSRVARTPEEIKLAASRRPYSIYTSAVIDLYEEALDFDELNWNELGVATGDGETVFDSTNLVAQWNFNETSGTTANNDAEGTSCGGTPANCDGSLSGFDSTASQDADPDSSWTANNRRWGAGALQFDGTNSYVCSDSDANGSCDDVAALENIKSIELWFKSTSASVTLVDKQTSGIGANGYTVQINSTGQLYADYVEVGTQYSATSIVKVNDGQWHHVVVVYNNPGGIYIDGILQSAVTLGSISDSNTNALYIGSNNGSSAFFRGVLDSIKIYSDTLTHNEILSNYNSANVEFQTRVGPDTSPDDGNWDSWTPTSGETQIQSLDNDYSNWTWDPLADASIVTTSDDTTTFYEGSGSMKIEMGRTQLDANPVALWHLDETNGDNAGVDIFDATTNNNDGEFNGSNLASAVVDGISGKAREFNDTDDYISIPYSSSVKPTDVTVMGWIKQDVTAAGGIFSWQYDYNGGSTNAQGFAIYTEAGDTIRIYSRGVGGEASTDTIPIGEWTHFAISTSNTTGESRFYINGVADSGGPKARAGTLTYDTSDTSAIGARVSGGTPAVYFGGSIDEVVMYDSVLNGEQVAEAYRMGANHYLFRELSSTDLTAKGKLAFNIASDRPGTYLEALIGESGTAVSSPSANYEGFWKLDEIGNGTCDAGTDDFCNAIGLGGNLDIVGTPPVVTGKIGLARDLNGSTTSLNGFDSSALDFAETDDFSIGAWVKHDGAIATTDDYIITKVGAVLGGYKLYMDLSGDFCFAVDDDSTWSPDDSACTSGIDYDDSQWHHVVGVKDDTTAIYLYVDGVLVASDTSLATTGTLANGNDFNIGVDRDGSSNEWDGVIDEAFVTREALSASDIRQMHERDARVHPITIDFAAKLTTTDLITGSTDTSFQIDETAYGATERSEHLFNGDKIIIRETVDDTTYIAQGTVISTKKGSGDTIVASWDSASTFPSAGFTANASVFKWQTEYFDISNLTLDSFMDAITALTLRVTNGNEGRTVWLDDLRSVSDYLTTPAGSTITSDTGERFLQYRAILSSTDEAVSATMSAVTVDYQSSAAAGHWKFDEGADNTCSGGVNDVCDSSINAGDGTISGATWQPQNMCANGLCLYFDGTDDVVTITSSDNISLSGQLASAFTIAGWAKPNSDGEGSVGEIFNKGTNTYARITNEGTDGYADLEVKLDLATTDATVTITDGIRLDNFNHIAIAYTDDGDDEVSVYINGLLRGASTNGDGSPATDTNNFLIGGSSSANFHGFLDDFKIFETEKSEGEIKSLFIKDSPTNGATASFDDPLSDGLMGYWELDENSGNAADSSGNGLTLTNNGTTTFTQGKFSNGSEHVPASTQYLSTATAIDNIKTISFWVNPDSTTNYFIDLDGGTSYISATSGTISTGGFANPIIYVNGAITTTLAADTWQLVTVTTNTEIDASAFKVGLIGANYFDGTMDEVRVYNRTLSEMEVVSLYNWAPGPIGYWPFDENTYQETDGYTTPTFDASATTGSAGSQNNLTASITVGNNSNRIILVGVATRAQAVSSVVFDSGGGDELTLTAFDSDTRTDAGAYLYYGVAPAVGTYNVTVNLAASDVHAFTVVTYYGVDQTTPLNEATSNTGSAAGAVELTVPTTARSIAIDLLSKINSADTPTAVSPQVERAKIVGTGGGSNANRMWSAISENTTTPTATMDWTWANARAHAFVAAALNGTPYPRTSDKSGGGNPASLVSMGESSWVPGKFGSALNFDGSTDYATVPDSNILDVTGGITVSGWVKFDTAPTGTTSVIRKDTSYIGLQTTVTQLRCVMFPGGATTIVNYGAHADISSTQWHHYSCTYDGATIRTYIDGVLTNSTAATGAIQTSSYPLCIGAACEATLGEFSDVSVDEVKIYGYARTPSQIIEDMNGGHPVGGSPLGSQIVRYKLDELNQSTAHNYRSPQGPGLDSLVSWWSFDESSGSVIDSHSSNDLAEYSGTIDAGTGIVNGARDFETGDTEAVFKADNAELSMGDIPVSIGVWVNMESVASGMTILGKWTGATEEYRISYVASGVNKFRFTVGDGSGNTGINTSGGAPATGEWHFIQAYHDPTTDEIGIRRNNGAWATTAHSTGILDAGIAFVIGATGSPDSYYDGLVDETFIYKRLLTNDEWGWFYNNGGARSYPELQATDVELNGTISGATWKHGSDCKIYGCLDFDGTDDVVTTTNSNAIDFDTGLSQAVSFTAWINADSDGENNVGEIFNKGTNTYCRTDSQGTTDLDLECSLDLDTTDATVNIADGLTTDTWHHIAMVYTDDSDDEIEVYIDGLLRGTSTNGVGSPATGDTNDLLIGGSSAANFDGSIDEFHLYDLALTKEQVLLDRNANSQASLGGTLGATEKSTITGGAGNGPIGWWKLDENTGTTYTYDSSGNSYTGTLTSISESSWVPGKFGSSLNLDGSADYVAITGEGAAFSNTSYTVSSWAYRTMDTGRSEPIFDNRTTSTTGYTLRIQGSTDLAQCRFNAVDTDSTTTIALNTWYHIACVSDGSTQKIYVNGILEDSDAITGSISESTDALIGGESPPSPDTSFGGRIDEIKLYDYALTQGQVAYEYNRGGPVGWWRMDEGTGTTTTYDASGKGYNLTLNGIAEGDWTTGKYGSAISYDGTDDYAYCTDAGCGGTTKLDFGIASAFSYGAWFKATATGTQQRIIGKKSTSAASAGYMLDTNTSNLARCKIADGTNNSAVLGTAGADNTWHHVMCVHTGTALYLYQDGVLVATDSDTSDVTATLDNTSDFRLGAAGNDSDDLTGQVDDARVYNYALSATQIRNIMNLGAQRFGE